MKNKYEIISSTIPEEISRKVNEYMESGVEVAFIGGVTFANEVFCQSILLINKETIKEEDIYKAEEQQEVKESE